MKWLYLCIIPKKHNHLRIILRHVIFSYRSGVRKFCLTLFFFFIFVGSGVRTFTPFYFLVEPVDTLSSRGSSVILNCSAYSEPSPKIEWKKDGTFLNLVSDDRRQLLPDGSLFITNVVHAKHNKPDEGYYQCVATVENLGTIVSRTAKLTVASKFC